MKLEISDGGHWMLPCSQFSNRQDPYCENLTFVMGDSCDHFATSVQSPASTGAQATASTANMWKERPKKEQMLAAEVTPERTVDPKPSHRMKLRHNRVTPGNV